MMMFWIGVACLVLLAWLMVWPAWRPNMLTANPRGGDPVNLAPVAILGEQLAALDRDLAAGVLDAQQHELAKLEVQRRMLDESGANVNPLATAGSRKAVLFVGLAVPLFALAVYGVIGNPGGLAPTSASAAGNASEVTPEAVEAMLVKLAQRMEAGTGDPASDLQGWTMLAHSYAVLQRFAESDRAYARAVALAPDDPQLLADRADVLAMLQGQSMAGEPDRLIAKALQIDPRLLKALALAGSSAYQRKDFAAARSNWQQARDLAPPGGEFAADMDRSLVEVASAMGAAGTAASQAPKSASIQAAEAGPARITGRVSLAPALAASAQPTDTVFIFARAAGGPRMPLAILKRTVAELPITFTLDDSMAMSPEMKLSKFPRVIVGARVSRSGNAMPQPGDLNGESAPKGTSDKGLELVIDTVQR